MKKILAVDDEEGIRTLLKESLEMEGYVAYTAKNGMEAMESLKYQPDLIIMDINMPDIDGYTVCEKIRDYVDCPILFLTARTEEQDRVNGFKAGGDSKAFWHGRTDGAGRGPPAPGGTAAAAQQCLFHREPGGGFFRPTGACGRKGRRPDENRIFHCRAFDFP